MTVSDRIFRDYILYFEKHKIDVYNNQKLCYQPSIYYDMDDEPIICNYLNINKYFKPNINKYTMLNILNNGGSNQKYIINNKYYKRTVIEMKTGLNFEIKIKKYKRIKFIILRTKQRFRRNRHTTTVDID